MNTENTFEVRHCKHTDSTYSMTIERKMDAESRPMTSLDAKTYSTNVTFYTLTTDEMLELANAIMQQAFKIKERKEQDSVPRQA